jgi:hypothetical protein
MGKEYNRTAVGFVFETEPLTEAYIGGAGFSLLELYTWNVLAG